MIQKLIAIIVAALVFTGVCSTGMYLTGCATDANGKQSLTPAAKQAMDNAFSSVLTVAVATAENIALNAATQQLTTGKINTKQLETVAITSSLSSGAAQIRSLQATPQAASGPATVNALLAGSTSPAATAITTPVTLPTGTKATLTTTVQAAVSSQVAAGVPANTANENVANALDVAAASPNVITP